jgi:hypothetical protein
MCFAPAVAKAWTMAICKISKSAPHFEDRNRSEKRNGVTSSKNSHTPIPVPPPVMRTTLPATDSSGRLGSVAGVGS